MPESIDRAQEIKSLIEQNPGITSKEISEKLGITAGRVCQLLTLLRGAGSINQKRQGRGMALSISDVELRRKYITRRWEREK